jgi:hypothetical protein
VHWPISVIGILRQLAVAIRFAAARTRSVRKIHHAAGVRKRVIINSAFSRLKTSAYLNHQRKLSAEMDVAAQRSGTARTTRTENTGQRHRVLVVATPWSSRSPRNLHQSRIAGAKVVIWSNQPENICNRHSDEICRTVQQPQQNVRSLIWPDRRTRIPTHPHRHSHSLVMDVPKHQR